MEYRPLHFIGEEIQVQFDREPLFSKQPGCPDRFVWQDRSYSVEGKIAEWKDFSRSGRMARNMSSEHASRAETRGSWGVGRFYFRVLTGSGQVFDLYYDRAPKDVNDRMGTWFLYREMEKTEDRGLENGQG